MKFPRRLSDILKQKQDFIDESRAKMESSVVRLQSQLFNDIVSKLVPELDVKDGMIQDNAKNYRLLSVLDKTYKDFNTVSSQVIFGQVVTATAKIADLSQNYFNAMFTIGLPEKFDKVISTTDKLINLRLGLDGGKLVRGGFLQSFFDSNTIGTDLKQMTSRAVTSNLDMKDYVQMLQDKITGTKDYTGGLERQFQRYAYDLYQQYDAAYNMTLGNEFGFTYFVYQGGLVKDSRAFCIEHNNKVWSVEEAQSWGTWIDPTTGEVPSYLGYPGYDPLIDRGGYNCRHSLGWVDDSIAIQMRPDLKENTI
jgi:hypothetical protein